MKKLFVISFFLLLIDVISKRLVINFMLFGESIKIIDNFFSLTYVRNTGIAFSFMDGFVPLIITMTVIILFMIIKYVKSSALNKFEIVGYSFVIGGAIGNLVDRIIYGYVIDFLDFTIFLYDKFPIFNFADIFIVLGVFMIIISYGRNGKKMKLVANRSVRIDKYLMEEIGYSRSKIQRMIESGSIIVNDMKVKNSYILKNDDNIYIDEGYSEDVDIVPEDIDLDIVYEDDYLLVVNKPSGMVVHPAVGNYSGTLVNGLMHHCNSNLSSVNGCVRPGIVHRIDKDTSGLLVVAKSDDVHDNLARQISEKSVVREYVSLVNGVIQEDTATIDAPIGRDVNDRKKMSVTDVNSKDAITHIRVIERLRNATLIECRLETGRTHQIRVHLSYIGHSVVNDPVYGKKKMDDLEFGQMLHARTLGFVHPITKQYLEFSVDVPDRFKEILNKYRMNS